LQVLAEGIETEGQLQFLIEHACQMGQGFHLCPPIPGEEVASRFLRSGQVVRAEVAL
jgi:EAL domain-containing protein (putative c-di-GMP-specific phosphodiesterase class I)